jgi:integrase
MAYGDLRRSELLGLDWDDVDLSRRLQHLDSTQRYTRVNAHELRGAIRRLRWVG